MKQVLSLLLMLGTITPARASLPSNLTLAEAERLVEVFGLSSVTRVMRSADVYRFWPGVKLGVEVVVVPSLGINDLGNQDGTAPGFSFVPRIYLAKGLFLGLELIANFFPVNVTNGLGSMGVALKWTAMKETDNPFAFAPFISLSQVSGLGGYEGSAWEGGAILSRDLVRLKPYIGAGLVVANGAVSATLSATNTILYANESSIHLFGGIEIETPMNVTIQADFMNTAFSASIFVGKKF